MFRTYIYELKRMIHDKSLMMWTIAFPVFMITIFTLAIGNIGEMGTFDAIPIAVVEEGELGASNQVFKSMLGSLEELDEPVLAVDAMDKERASYLLEEGEITGIFLLENDDIRLYVAHEGLNQSVLMMISNRFYQMQNTLTTIGEIDPHMLPQAIEYIQKELEINVTTNGSRGVMNPLVGIVFVFLAYSTFTAMFTGLKTMSEVQANRGPLGARRMVAPTKKLRQLLPGFLAGLTMTFLYNCVVLVYVLFTLDFEFGSRLPLVILTLLVGNAAAIGIGMFISLVGKGSDKTLDTYISIAMMAMAMLAGMMSLDVRLMVRQRIPILDRINPFTMFVDSLYALGTFNDLRIYFNGLLGMAGIAVIFCVVSAFILRSKKYDSI